MVSQATQRTQLTEDDMDRTVNEIIATVLTQDHNKRPIKRPDLTKHTEKAPGRKFDQVLKAVQAKLENIFGLRLVDLGGTPSRYCLVNKFSSEQLSKVLTVSQSTSCKQSLLTIILANIFMTGHNIKESDLWDGLRILNILPDPKHPHPLFGDVKKLVLTDFVRQQYLEHTRIEGSDPPMMELRWGPRAHKEYSKRNILEFVCKMFGGMESAKWTAQWQLVQAEGDAEEEAESGDEPMEEDSD